MTILKKLSSSFLAIGVMLMVGCNTIPNNSQISAGEMEIRSGIIEQITSTQIKSNQHTGVGAVVGGIAGLGIGSLIGNGSGRDVAMVLGTLGGALAGNEVQKKNDQPIPGQQIVVRVNSGVLVSITQPVNSNLHKGQHVYVEGSGEGAHVVGQ